MVRIGATLVADDPLAPADALALGPDIAAPGVLEAADLVHRGIATRVAVLADPVAAITEEFAQRGVAYPDPSAELVRLLHDLGVQRVDLLRLSGGGTEEAGQLIADWSARHRFSAIVVVTSPDHSRRVRRVLRRNLHNSGTRVIVRASRYSAFAAGNWWQQRGTLRTGIVELQKLGLDLARHPLP